MSSPHGFILCLLYKLRLVLILSQASHHLFVCHHIFVCAFRNYIVISSTIYFETHSSFVCVIKKKKNQQTFIDFCEHLPRELSKIAVCLCLTIIALFSSFCSWTNSDVDLCYFCRKSYGLCKTFAFFYKTWYPTGWCPCVVTASTFIVFTVAASTVHLPLHSIFLTLHPLCIRYISVLQLFVSTLVSSSISLKTFTHFLEKSGQFHSVTFLLTLLLPK